jgi:hypothetical protein
MASALGNPPRADTPLSALECSTNFSIAPLPEAGETTAAWFCRTQTQHFDPTAEVRAALNEAKLYLELCQFRHTLEETIDSSASVVRKCDAQRPHTPATAALRAENIALWRESRARFVALDRLEMYARLKAKHQLLHCVSDEVVYAVAADFPKGSIHVDFDVYTRITLPRWLFRYVRALFHAIRHK